MNSFDDVRQRQDEEKRKELERVSQSNMMNQNMQMMQMAMMSHFVQTLTGITARKILN